MSRASGAREDKPARLFVPYHLPLVYGRRPSAVVVLPWLLARWLVALFQGKINLKGSSAAMVVCTVSPVFVSRKENLDGSSTPMVACTVSPAAVSREDKTHSDPPAPKIASTACRDCSLED